MSRQSMEFNTNQTSLIQRVCQNIGYEYQGTSQSVHASFVNQNIDEESKDEQISLNLRPETLDKLKKEIKNALNEDIPIEFIIEDL